ncbi:nuclease-related domain-containing protein [Bacillus sp. FJAT-27251]|uniref:nuclease-related domain-containing protein n=1 Tax=Bacillus sp. FJAT-27251 TaxID=1684142 RepID=UPI0006A7C894|nr:nuclease-related domain-containing protein [Bacillus sp. FJAT-27251]
MIAKKRVKPLKIRVNEAILRRVPPRHPQIQKVTTDLAKWKAGLRGEEEADYYLSLLPEKEFSIFQDVRLQHQGSKFQIDHILLSPHFVLPLSVKNYAGEVIFNPGFNQITRILNNQEEGFEDPIVQAKRHQYLLGRWMKEMRLPPIPIDFLVTFGKSTTILKNPAHSREVYDKVCLAGSLIFKINKVKNLYPKEILNSKEVNKWTKAILKHHMPEAPSYTAYHIPHTDFIPGVQCPACQKYRMFRIRGCWKCPACGAVSKDAHLQAIQDYFLLINPTLTNRQLQDFLHLHNSGIISKILASTSLPHTGFRKDRIYYPKSTDT